MNQKMEIYISNNGQQCLQQKGIEFEQALALLSQTLTNQALINEEGAAVLSVISDYARSWSLLQGYDEQSLVSAAKSAGFDTITDIGRARIVRAHEALKNSNPEASIDGGFKLFRLNQSNIQAWNLDSSELEETLLDHQEHLIEGRTENDVLYELLLKRGVDLAVPIENREMAGKTVSNISYGVLFACLDEPINKDQIEEIGQGIVEWHRELVPSSDTHVFFSDSAFSDDVSKAWPSFWSKTA